MPAQKLNYVRLGGQLGIGKGLQRVLPCDVAHLVAEFAKKPDNQQRSAAKPFVDRIKGFSDPVVRRFLREHDCPPPWVENEDGYHTPQFEPWSDAARPPACIGDLLRRWEAVFAEWDPHGEIRGDGGCKPIFTFATAMWFHQGWSDSYYWRPCPEYWGGTGTYYDIRSLDDDDLGA